MSQNTAPVSSECLYTTQNTYADYLMKQVSKNGPLIILMPALFNLCMLAADTANMYGEPAFTGIVILRVVYTFMLVFLMMNIRKIRSFSTYSWIITIYEVVFIGIFLFVLRNYSEPDYLIQTLGVVTIILCVYLIPNMFVKMLFVVGASELSFLVCAGLWLPDTDPSHFAAGAVYITITAVLSAFFANNTQHSLENEFLARRELQRQSSTDHLTQASSRFKFEEEAARWIVFCRRQGIPLSLVFVDVDNLKPINDRHGHLSGDKVLTEVVNRIREVLQEGDVVARWGGDEFVLLLPDVDRVMAKKITEMIRQAIAQKPLLDNIDVTCSFGVVSMDSESTFESMIRTADDLMYKSKRLGKNRIEDGAQ